MIKANYTLLILLAMIFVLRIFWLPALGFYFLVTVIMWIVGFSYFTEQFSLNKRNATTILLFKMAYLFSNEAIYYFNPNAKEGWAVFIVMVVVCACELIFLRVNSESLQKGNKKSDTAKVVANKGLKVIEFRYLKCKLGDKDSFFGEDEIAQAMRKLALSGVTIVSTLISVILAYLFGCFFVFSKNSIFIALTIIVFLLMSVLFYCLLHTHIQSEFKRFLLSIYLSAFVVFFFIQPLAQEKTIFGNSIRVYIYTCLFGAGSIAHALFTC